MLFFLALAVLLSPGGCLVIRYSEAGLGQSAAFSYPCPNYPLMSVSGADGETLVRYELFNVHITYPDLHSAGRNNVECGFLIKQVAPDDAQTYSWHNSSSVVAQDYLYVHAQDNSELKNRVVDSDTYLRLAYQTTPLDGSSVLVSLLQHPNNIETDIFYGDDDSGGVLPGGVGSFKASTGNGSFGVSVDPQSLSFFQTGRFQYYVTNPTYFEQKVFNVAYTRNFACQPAEYLITGKEHFHNCSAEVSHGDIVPEFTWTKNGEILSGTIRKVKGSSSILYTYTYTFEAGIGDINGTFDCGMEFKYNGTESEIRDTSDPDYTDTCQVTYSEIEYAVYDPSISIGISSVDGPVILKVGDNLTCQALGTSPIAYEWICGDDLRYSGQSLEITGTFFTHGYTSCECTASNTLSDENTYTATKEIKLSVAHQSNILTPPPAVIFSAIGTRVQLDCTLAPYFNSSSSLGGFRYQWTANFYEDNDFMKTMIYNAFDTEHGVLDKWVDQFDVGQSKHDLVMKSAKFELEGLYKCEAIRYPNVYSFEVIPYFFGTATCMTPKRKIKQGETVGITCQIEHSGSIEPEIVWYADDGTQIVQSPAKTLRKTFSSLREVEVHLETKPGVNYKCRVSFSSGSSTFTDECTADFDFNIEAEQTKEELANEIH